MRSEGSCIEKLNAIRLLGYNANDNLIVNFVIIYENFGYRK